jgi:hypothetical protein
MENKFMKKTNHSKIGFVFEAICLGTLTGCVGYVEGPHERVYAPAPAVYVEPQVVIQDDYVITPVTRFITAATGTCTPIGKAVHGYRGRRHRMSRLTCCLPRRR